MSVEVNIGYPGEAASAQQLLTLAGEYRAAANALLQTGRRGEPLSRAPYRFVAIHAVERYLNAYLLAVGHPAARLRGLLHDLASRTELTIAARLSLRKRTPAHLQSLSQSREYLIARDDPDIAATCELNRLAATLAEVAGKVTRFVDAAGG